MADMRIPCWELTLSPFQGTLEDDVPFPKVGFVGSLDGIIHNLKYLGSITILRR